MHKIFKKTIVFTLIFANLLTFASCGQNTEGNISEEKVSASPSIEESVESVTEDTDKKEEENTVTSVSEEEKEESGAEKAEPILCDSVMNKMGCRVGCAVTSSEIEDEKVWEIITTEFNAVTLGNELKPDCLFNYSNSVCPGTETAELNGETIEVPKLTYTRANKMLDKILEWNEANPDRKLSVRGHVLVWHSQTPEWFFHVGYDKNNAYADKETMNKRLEWYIKTVLTYYTGEDSKYKDLFYGWDVVNEAISDNGGLRTDAESSSESLSQDTHGSNSSWYHIYGSNEYIINAFKYANKYAPESLELYYNDYNECSTVKQKSIIELLEAIKAEEGEPGVGTRLTAMGMQGHYSMDYPQDSSVNAAILAYAKVVGNVQFTEMDIQASSDYDGTDATKDAENEKLRKRYFMLYFYMQSAQKESYVNITGITFWGTVDKYSWLQTRSDVGGGSTSGLPQMPLLFDENYEKKPAFYVFATGD